MIVVTGGAGFIGSALIWALNKSGRDNILVVDHMGTSSKWKNLAGLRFRDYIEKDLFLEQLNRGAISGLDGIIHLGACSSTTEMDVSYLMKNNFEYSKSLARFSAEKNLRFVYASSAATYGDGHYGFSDVEDIERLKPLNPYGFSKQLFDLWIEQNGLLEKTSALK